MNGMAFLLMDTLLIFDWILKQPPISTC